MSFGFAIFAFVVLLLAHFLADFQFQSRSMALNKSVDVRVLMQHVGVHFLVFFWAGLAIFGSIWAAFVLTTINAAMHGLVDWNVWRSYKRRARDRMWDLLPFGATLRDGQMVLSSGEVTPLPEFRFWEDDRFWLTIGIDQMLHGFSMLLALYLAGSI